jgi:hypothetical protein
MTTRARRLILISSIAAALLPVVWLYEPASVRVQTLDIEFHPLPLPPQDEIGDRLGPFRLTGAWRTSSRFFRFGGYSSLLSLGRGRMLALSDRGRRLEFSQPGVPQHPPVEGATGKRGLFDAESATLDSATGTIWIGWENANVVTRQSLAFEPPKTRKPWPMGAWGSNGGAEAMVRLRDGRFVILREDFTGWWEDRLHQGLLFARDPLAGKPRARVFSFAGPKGYSPTDMAQLPDGRVLILMRRLAWLLPPRFEGRIVIADPARIREGETWQGPVLARLEAPLPVDNFEGLAIEPASGRESAVTVWLISDDNGAATQRTLLWKLAFDPAKVP